METKLYTCAYCFEEFKPTRRRIQRFCSDTCRSKHWQARKTKPNTTTLTTQKVENQESNKSEKMSLAGTRNAFAGSLLADGIKSALTPKNKKPATKEDIENLKIDLLGRYHPINNMQPDFKAICPIMIWRIRRWFILMML